jgi:hypothetical protein
MYEMLTYGLPYDDVADDEMVLCRHTLNPHWRPHLPPDKRLPVPPNVHLQVGVHVRVCVCEWEGG